MTTSTILLHRFASSMVTTADGFFPISRSELGDLADPTRYTDPLNTTGWDPGFLGPALRDMILFRIVEECIGSLVESADARAPCHLGIGQEAVAVGISAHLR